LDYCSIWTFKWYNFVEKKIYDINFKMFGLFFKRLLFVIFLIIEVPLLFMFFGSFSSSLSTGGIAFVMIIVFVLYLGLNWIFSAFD